MDLTMIVELMMLPAMLMLSPLPKTVAPSACFSPADVGSAMGTCPSRKRGSGMGSRSLSPALGEAPHPQNSRDDLACNGYYSGSDSSEIHGRFFQTVSGDLDHGFVGLLSIRCLHKQLSCGSHR